MPRGRGRMEKAPGPPPVRPGGPRPLITHRFQGLEQVETAFRLMAEKPPELVKAVVAL